LFKKRNICQSKEIKRKTRVWLSFIIGLLGQKL